MAMANLLDNVPIADDKAKLQEILSRDEFSAYHRQGFDLSDWIADRIKALYYWFSELMDGLFPNSLPPLSNGMADLISYVVIAAGLGLLAYLIYWFASQLMVQKRLAMPINLSEDQLKQSYVTYMQQADQSANEENWKEGARHLFLALLFYCHTKKWIKVEKWKTNGEYAQELRVSQPNLLKIFAEGAHVYDEVWYGKKTIDASAFRELYLVIEPLVKEVDSADQAQ